MQVNAQVTAMTSFLELLGSVTIVFTLWATKGTTVWALIHGEIFYVILLPHAFLMNTSHNKNRIVDYGWRSVFRNIIGRSPKFDEPNPIKTKVQTPPMAAKQRRQHKGKFNNKIFTTSASHDVIDRNSPVEPSVFDPIASFSGKSSKRRKQISETKIEPLHIALDVRNMDQEHYNNELMKRLVKSMTEVVKDEDEYIIYFKRLVAFLDGCEKGEAPSEFDLENEFPTNSRHNDQLQNIKIKTKGINTPFTTGLENGKETCLGNPIKQTVKQEEETKNRIAVRTEMLYQLNSIYSQRKKRNYLIERLIDQEESFFREY